MMSSFVPRVTLPDSVLDLPWLTIIQPWPLPVRISYNRIYCTLQQKLHPTVTWFSKSKTPVTIDDKDGPELTSSCKFSSSLSMFTRTSQAGKTNRPMRFDLFLLVAIFALCWCIADNLLLTLWQAIHFLFQCGLIMRKQNSRSPGCQDNRDFKGKTRVVVKLSRK